MKIQNILFPKYGICSDFELYVRLSNNYNYSYQNSFIYFNTGHYAHFDTYFNSFMKNKWAKYTNLSNLYIELELKGAFRITLLNKEREINGTVTNKFLDEIEIKCSNRQIIKIPFKNFEQRGMYTFSLYAIENDSIFFGGNYGTNDPIKVHDVNLGLAICTYKREQYIFKNIQNLKTRFLDDEHSELYNHLYIFISDNANSLNNLLPKDPYIHVFPNRNVGGAGGFTRCLIEIMQKSQYNITHALMMDDDITFDPEVLFRTYSFLSILKEEYLNVFVGGSMLRMDIQSIQTESGAVWNGGNLKSLKHNLSLSSCEACLYNDIEESCDYNAWWYCAIPMQYIRPDNLPMPIFIRGDDVEYGLRNAKHIVLLNGICVWHEPFENKYSSIMYYYIYRNRMIDNSVRSIHIPLNNIIKDFEAQWRNEMLLCRYKNAHLLVDGVMDFLKGIDWIINTDAEHLNREVLKKGYKLVDITKLDFEYSYHMYEEALNYIPPSDKFLTRLRIKLNLLRHDQNIVIPAFNPTPRYCLNATKILNYDYSSEKGFITEYNARTRKAEIKYYKKCINLLKKKYNRISDEYCTRKSELNNLEFWKKYLQI